MNRDRITITADQLMEAFRRAKEGASESEFGDDSLYHNADVEMCSGYFAQVDGIVGFGSVAYHLSAILNDDPHVAVNNSN